MSYRGWLGFALGFGLTLWASGAFAGDQWISYYGTIFPVAGQCLADGATYEDAANSSLCQRSASDAEYSYRMRNISGLCRVERDYIGPGDSGVFWENWKSAALEFQADCTDPCEAKVGQPWEGYATAGTSAGCSGGCTVLSVDVQSDGIGFKDPGDTSFFYFASGTFGGSFCDDDPTQMQQGSGGLTPTGSPGTNCYINSRGEEICTDAGGCIEVHGVAICPGNVPPDHTACNSDGDSASCVENGNEPGEPPSSPPAPGQNDGSGNCETGTYGETSYTGPTAGTSYGGVLYTWQFANDGIPTCGAGSTADGPQGTSNGSGTSGGSGDTNSNGSGDGDSGFLDTDGDGVPDGEDYCNSTAPGLQVATNGCASGESPDDGDGDGVADLDDRCKQTPVGETVDANGCAVGDSNTGDGKDDGQQVEDCLGDKNCLGGFFGPSVGNSPTFGQSLSSFTGRVSGSPVVQAASSFGGAIPTGGTCPAGSVSMFGTAIVFDAHCALAEDVRPILGAIFLVVWAWAAFRIFMSA